MFFFLFIYFLSCKGGKQGRELSGQVYEDEQAEHIKIQKEEKRKSVELAGLEDEEKCYSGSVTECIKLAQMYERGGDFAKAIRMYDAACILSDWRSCALLSGIYANGFWGVQRGKSSFRASVEYSRRSMEIMKDVDQINAFMCERGFSGGCFFLALKIKDKMKNAKGENGRGLKSDMAGEVAKNTDTDDDKDTEIDDYKKILEKAFEFARRECSEGAPVGCVILGVMYSYGEGVTKDEDKALDFFRMGCDLDYASACYQLGGRLMSVKKKEAIRYLKKACELGEHNACFALWEEFRDKKYLKEACLAGVSDRACQEVFEEFRTPQTQDKM